MNSNKDNSIMEISNILSKFQKKDEIFTFLNEIFTLNELEILSKRWRILKLLSQNKTQREIAAELNVSLCKVTRGSKILKDKKAITTKILKEGI